MAFTLALSKLTPMKPEQLALFSINTTPSGLKIPKGKVNKACVACSAQKLKCEGPPLCGSCVRKGRDCVFGEKGEKGSGASGGGKRKKKDEDGDGDGPSKKKVKRAKKEPLKPTNSANEGRVVGDGEDEPMMVDM